MIQRDLKIGLVLGLVLVIAVIVKFAMDPRLSPEARITQLNNSAESGRISDSNKESQTFVLSEIQVVSEPAGVQTGQMVQDVNEHGSVLVANDTSIKSQDTTPESRLETKDVPLNVQTPEESPVSQNTDTTQTSGETNNNSSVTQEPVKLLENFDYDKAEVIKTQKFHIVLKNETLSDISRKYYGSTGQWKKIAAANSDVIKDPNKVKAGTKLIIP